MSDILQFPGAETRKKRRRKKTTLCKNGHHKWVVDKQSVFDVKQGKLVTVERCARCEATRQRLS